MLTCTHCMRAHFRPEYWLLCYLDSYKSKFELLLSNCMSCSRNSLCARIVVEPSPKITKTYQHMDPFPSPPEFREKLPRRAEVRQHMCGTTGLSRVVSGATLPWWHCSVAGPRWQLLQQAHGPPAAIVRRTHAAERKSRQKEFNQSTARL